MADPEPSPEPGDGGVAEPVEPESADAPADSPPPVSAVESIEAPEVAERRAAAIAANGKRSTSRTPVGCRLRRLY